MSKTLTQLPECKTSGEVKRVPASAGLFQVTTRFPGSTLHFQGFREAVDLHFRKFMIFIGENRVLSRTNNSYFLLSLEVEVVLEPWLRLVSYQKTCGVQGVRKDLRQFNTSRKEKINSVFG